MINLAKEKGNLGPKKMQKLAKKKKKKHTKTSCNFGLKVTEH